MRQFVKSYHVFLSRIWDRAFLYLIYPLLLIWLTYKLTGLGVTPELCIVLDITVIVMVELFYDFIVFGGIASKDTNKLEYLKTSTRGMRILRQSIIADGIRRAFSVAVVLMSAYVMNTEGFAIINLVLCIIVTLFCIEMGLIIVRSVSMQGFAMAANTIIGIVAQHIIDVLCKITVPMWGSCLLIALYAAAFVLGRAIIMRKARGSYYDNRD